MTISRGDKIMVMEDGRIVERGTHEELMALSGRYRKLYGLQFSTETGGRGGRAKAAASRPR